MVVLGGEFSKMICPTPAEKACFEKRTSSSRGKSKECKSFLNRSMNHSDIDTVDDTLAKIGNNIKTLRISKGISQQELANLASIDRAFISTIENGKRNLSVSVLHKIATNLDSNISEIFKD